MQKLKIFGLLAMVWLIAASSACNKKSPTPQDDCIEGVVIAEEYNIHSYNPETLYACETVVQIKNRNIGVKWGNFDNCVVIRNLDVSLRKINQKVYFESFEEIESCGPWYAICAVPAGKCIIAKNLSVECKKIISN